MVEERQLHWFPSLHQKFALSSRRKTRTCPGFAVSCLSWSLCDRTSPWGRTHVAGWELSRSHWESHAVAIGRWGQGNSILKVPLLMAEEISARCSTSTRVRMEGACLLPLWEMGAMMLPSLVLSPFDESTLHSMCCVCTTRRLSDREELMTISDMSAKN